MTARFVGWGFTRPLVKGHQFTLGRLKVPVHDNLVDWWWVEPQKVNLTDGWGTEFEEDEPPKVNPHLLIPTSYVQPSGYRSKGG
eukprot:762788-Hanusia_phi.AAC.1